MTQDDFNLNNPAPLEHSVRLLYPFWIEPGQLDRAVRALCAQRQAGHKREFKTWQEAGRVPDGYREEILPLVSQVLFGIRSGAHRYLRVDGATLGHWFPEDGLFEAAPGHAAPAGAAHAAYALTPGGEGVELFLSPHGAGVLALTFACARPGGLKSLQAFNYRLSQLRAHSAWQHRIPHDARGEHPAPGAEAPFEQRLGAGGGALTLKELVDFLLAPLNAFGLLETQQRFSVYSVTRFDHGALFTDEGCQARLRPFLAALAHVEEEAGQQGSLKLRARVLNPRHWAAVGSLGAAHLVADQDPPGPLDRQRLPRSLCEYFVPYLCAALQRLTLQRLLWETDSAALETDGSLSERQARLRRLRQDMLRFSVQGCFTEVSSREVHNQYYELAREGLRVAATLRLARRALGDMESATTAAYQQEAARETRKLARAALANAGLAVDLRRKAEWLAVFFASYYATALVHYVGDDFFSAAYTHWSLVATPFLSGGLAWLCVKPHAGRDGEPEESKPARRGAWLFPGVAAALFLAWAAAGWHFSLKENPGEERGAVCAGEAHCKPGANQGTI